MRVIHYESPPEHWDNSVRALHTVDYYIGSNLINFRLYLFESTFVRFLCLRTFFCYGEETSHQRGYGINTFTPPGDQTGRE